MAQSTTLNKNILGFTLVSNATSWGCYEHCGQDLLIVVSRDNAFPKRENSFGRRVDDTANLSFVSGAFYNTLDNWDEVQELYPSDTYMVFRGCMRGEELAFYLS